MQPETFLRVWWAGTRWGVVYGLGVAALLLLLSLGSLRWQLVALYGVYGVLVGAAVGCALGLLTAVALGVGWGVTGAARPSGLVAFLVTGGVVAYVVSRISGLSDLRQVLTWLATTALVGAPVALTAWRASQELGQPAVAVEGDG